MSPPKVRHRCDSCRRLRRLVELTYVLPKSGTLPYQLVCPDCKPGLLAFLTAGGIQFGTVSYSEAPDPPGQ